MEMHLLNLVSLVSGERNIMFVRLSRLDGKLPFIAAGVTKEQDKV